MSSKAKQAPKGAGKPPPKRKGKKDHKRDPACWLFTRAQVSLVDHAKKLKDLLRDLYGDAATISMLETAFEEISNNKAGGVDIYIPDSVMTAYSAYAEARDSRLAERQSFRVSNRIENTATAFAEARERLQGDGPQEE